MHFVVLVSDPGKKVPRGGGGPVALLACRSSTSASSSGPARQANGMPHIRQDAFRLE